MRIAKYIAHCGYCSRRMAEELILGSRVCVNGIVNLNLAYQVEVNSDIVEVNGDRINIPKIEVWLYHKPVGVITSRKDEKDRPTVFDKLPSNLRNFVTVGRLDYNSEGLLVLTNNGELSRFMELPNNKLVRVYKVRVFGRIDFNKMKSELGSGIEIDGMRYQPIDFKVINSQGMNSWLKLRITEGKNREIRNIMSHFGLSISRLIRVQHGPFSLGSLEANQCMKVGKLPFDFSAFA